MVRRSQRFCFMWETLRHCVWYGSSCDKLINNVVSREPNSAFSSMLRIISQTYKWIWKHLALMIRSTKSNTFGILTSCVTPQRAIDWLKGDNSEPFSQPYCERLKSKLLASAALAHGDRSHLFWLHGYPCWQVDIITFITAHMRALLILLTNVFQPTKTGKNANNDKWRKHLYTPCGVREWLTGLAQHLDG